MTTLFLVRHGESEWNLIGRVQGQDAAAGGLTMLGRAQARRAAAELAGRGAGSVVCSDLARARETAAIIAGVLGLPFSIDPDFREQHFGELQGKLLAGGDLAGEIDRFWAEPFRRPPGGETVAELYARVHRALGRYLGSSTIVVAHGGVVRVAMAAGPPVLGRPMDRVRVGNGSVSVVR